MNGAPSTTSMESASYVLLGFNASWSKPLRSWLSEIFSSQVLVGQKAVLFLRHTLHLLVQVAVVSQTPRSAHISLIVD